MTELYLDKGVGYMSVCVCQNRWNAKHPSVCKLYLNKKNQSEFKVVYIHINKDNRIYKNKS